ncbi:MAG TPA: hypothetical protein VL383_05080 [Gemmatimonadaceae bacterium]|nr:hypothetical protein [Gemmatimonadaceae bacterium]
MALLLGRLLTVDGEPAEGVRVVVQWSRDTAALGATDTLQADAVGRFADLIREAAGDSIRIVVSPSRESNYYAVAVTVARDRLAEEVRLLLVPRRWTIRRGRYGGETVDIDPRAALRRSPDRASFARVRGRRTVGWSADSYPIPIVFRRTRGTNVGAADSIAFWDTARAMDDAIGTPLFRPWSDTSALGRIFPVDVGVNSRIGSAAVTYVSWDSEGNVFEGSVSFRSARELRSRSIVEHELMHLLGFGHTTAWPSSVQPAGPPDRTITAEDAAYAQLLLRAHALEADPLVIAGLADAR